MMHWLAKRRLMSQLRERQPSQKTMDAVAACLTELGFGREHLVEEFAKAVAAQHTMMHDAEVARQQRRHSELLQANTDLVLRERAVLQTVRGMIAYAEQYAPDTVAPLKAVIAANKINL